MDNRKLTFPGYRAVISCVKTYERFSLHCERRVFSKGGENIK